jgi:hypothetical protein
MFSLGAGDGNRTRTIGLGICAIRSVVRPDLRFGVSASDRERPLVAGANGTLIARRSSLALRLKIKVIAEARCEAVPLGPQPRATHYGTLVARDPLQPPNDRRSSVQKSSSTWTFTLERVTGIHPALSAWEASSKLGSPTPSCYCDQEKRLLYSVALPLRVEKWVENRRCPECVKPGAAQCRLHESAAARVPLR